MRNNDTNTRTGRIASPRTAMLRKMVATLLENERIATTDAKARKLRAIAEQMISLGKKGDARAEKKAGTYIRDKRVVTKLFGEIAPRYQNVSSGYTRIFKCEIRPGDTAPKSVIELVAAEMKSEKGTKQGDQPATECARHPGGPTTRDDDDTAETVHKEQPKKSRKK